jgi:lipopolysaccharide biosynthesis glycosyltransferase
MNFLPIVFTCDDAYFKYANVVITSIIHNQNRNCRYEINVLSEFISNENMLLARKQLESHSNFTINFVILKDFDSSKFFLNSYMSISTYYRFYIPQLFSRYDRILYLDSDLIVDADISDFASLDFDDKLAICCPSPFIRNKVLKGDDEKFSLNYFTHVLKMPDPLQYFNAGVMLYNVKKMNEIDITTKLFEALEDIKEPFLQDQDILNSVLSNNGGVKLISSKYNMTRTFVITDKRLFLERLKEIFRISKKNNWFFIYHYVGKDKPWMTKRSDGLLFVKYAKMSPFYKQIFK